MIAPWKHGDLLPQPATLSRIAGSLPGASLVPPKEHLSTVGFARRVDVDWRTVVTHLRSQPTRR